MATQPTPDLDVLRRFGRTPEGRLLVVVLQARLAMLDQRNRHSLDVELYRGQGRALEIEELIQLFDASAAATGPQPIVPKRPKQLMQGLPIVNHMHVPD